jgi:hypothetical protein
MQHENRRRTFSAPSQVEQDTGLTPRQQRERATVARLWAWRITWLQQISGCRTVDALRAVEEADKENAE